MVLDRALAAPGDEDHLLDAGLQRLVDGILDERAINDGQHFLGKGLGSGQESRTQTTDGKHGLAQRLDGHGAT